MTANGYGAFLRGDKDVLVVDSGYGCLTLNILQTTTLYILKV